jgi:hypothetical protein
MNRTTECRNIQKLFVAIGLPERPKPLHVEENRQ